jgi:hypothetical protein
VKSHDLVSRLKAGRPDIRDLGFDIVHRETDVVEADPKQIANGGIGQGLRVEIFEQLNFRSR